MKNNEPRRKQDYAKEDVAMSERLSEPAKEGDRRLRV